MSCLLRTTRYDLKTGESTILSESVIEGEDRSEETLVRIFAKMCLEDFREKQKQT